MERRRVVGPHAVDARAKAAAHAAEARYLPEVGEELLDLLGQPAHVAFPRHAGESTRTYDPNNVPPISRILKGVAAVVGGLAYVWFRAVRAVPRVKRRKLARGVGAAAKRRRRAAEHGS